MSMMYDWETKAYKDGFKARENDIDSWRENQSNPWKRGWRDANHIALREGDYDKDVLDRATLFGCFGDRKGDDNAT